jgi:hypothetical protein
MLCNDVQKFIKGRSVNPKHSLKWAWIKTIHLFHSKVSIAMEISRLPSYFNWPIFMLTDIAGNEALLLAPLVATSQNCCKNCSIWYTRTSAGCHRHWNIETIATSPVRMQEERVFCEDYHFTQASYMWFKNLRSRKWRYWHIIIFVWHAKISIDTEMLPLGNISVHPQNSVWRDPKAHLWVLLYLMAHGMHSRHTGFSYP